MRFASWNVNSVKARLSNVLDWLAGANIDVLLLQELKCETSQFPVAEFSALGYQCHALGQKAYNGVAICSRLPVEGVVEHLPHPAADEPSRYIEASISGCRVASIYLPNGNPLNTEKFAYKLDWMRRLRDHAADLLKLEVPVVLGGDFNIIPEDVDVFDPKGWENDALFHPLSRAAWRSLCHTGFTEAFRSLHPELRHAYTYWDYQGGAWMRDLGLRIDHFLLSPEATDRLVSCSIDRTPRGRDKASDHTPIVLEILR